MFWLPIFLVIFFAFIMVLAGKEGLPGISLIAVLTHTLIVKIAFWEHPLLWMLIFFTVQLWAMFVVTFFQRNRWRSLEKMGSD
ncbi:hypothetical protein ACFPYN_14835 [Paenisporosarcina macmurdoensis]|uniref:Uncharacterized protein n=1 Tax=Paenisporosarcina macmurdoensis TaxID=212659 RepID=A0ABW1LBK4_9BACL